MTLPIPRLRKLLVSIFGCLLVASPFSPAQAISTKTPVGATLTGKLFFPDGFMKSVRDYGAVGDGITDDTAAIKAALADGRTNASAEYNGAPKALYFPPGVYLVRDTLTWNGCCVTLQGAGPASSVIRLAPQSPGYDSGSTPKAVLQTPAGNSSFRQNIWDIGFAVGQGNPGAIAIDYVSNNNGSIHNSSIVSEDGQGVTGIALTRHYPGPLLLKDVSIRGFQSGIATSAYEYGATLEGIILEGQTVAGINNYQQPIYIRGLKSTNSVPALINDGGFAVVVGARLIGTGKSAAAIMNRGDLYLREISTTVYQSTLLDSNINTTRDIRGTISEYVSGNAMTLTGKATTGSLGLPVSETPIFRDNTLSRWAGFVPNFYGDVGGLQALLLRGAKTIYFPFGAYLAYNEVAVTVPDSVQRIVGFSSVVNGSASGTNGGGIRLVVNSDSTTPLVVEQFGYGIKIEHRGKRPVVIKDGNYSYVSAPGAGPVYFEDVQTAAVTVQTGQQVWARQFNNEIDGTKITNNGNLWILGLKTERSGIVVDSKAGSQTEVLGGLIYPALLMPTGSVAFSINNARASYIYVQPVYCTGCGYSTQVYQDTNMSLWQIDSNPSARYVMPLFHSE